MQVGPERNVSNSMLCRPPDFMGLNFTFADRADWFMYEDFFALVKLVAIRR
jgi:hypothetical protein